MSKSVNIVLVDDHSILMDGIEALLQTNPIFRVVGKEQEGKDLLLRDDLSDIDLIIMDINMKGKDGVEVLKDVRAAGHNFRCIFLSSYDDLKLVNETINTGAQGYVTKASATSCLEEAILQVMNDNIYYSPDIKDRILLAFSGKTEKIASNNDESGILRQLTDREIDVLKLIALQFTSDEIAKELFIAKSTVDTHRKNLIAKLKVKNSVGLGLFAERNKLI